MREAEEAFALLEALERANMKTRLKTVGLFAGIGGIELGLLRAGHHVSLLCEIDPAARAVLAKRFPDARLADDVASLRALPYGTDLVTAGFPCQDLSQAGSTAGIHGSRSSLIGHLFRLLKDQEVPWVLIENVPFMLSLHGGAAMRRIVRTLESLGYAWAYRVVDSRAFGLPQRRKRVYLVASTDGDPASVLFSACVTPREAMSPAAAAVGFYWTEGNRGLGWAVDALPTLKGGSAIGIPSPPAAWFPSDEIIVPTIEAVERLQGFPPGWTRPAADAGRASRRWTLVGNAVTVDASEWLGRQLATQPSGSPTAVFELKGDAAWPSAALGYPWRERYGVDCSDWPVAQDQAGLVEFLGRDIEYLSARATAGFLARLQKSTLRRPPAFDRALKAHVERMSKHQQKISTS
jgi:DNA (cytosine-5)-methyltransferase 1